MNCLISNPLENSPVCTDKNQRQGDTQWYSGWIQNKMSDFCFSNTITLVQKHWIISMCKNEDLQSDNRKKSVSRFKSEIQEKQWNQPLLCLSCGFRGGDKLHQRHWAGFVPYRSRYTLTWTHIHHTENELFTKELDSKHRQESLRTRMEGFQIGRSRMLSPFYSTCLCNKCPEKLGWNELNSVKMRLFWIKSEYFLLNSCLNSICDSLTLPSGKQNTCKNIFWLH